MDILLSTDKNYIMPTGVAMKSVSVNNEEVTFHILVDSGVSAVQKESLEGVIFGKSKQRILFYEVDKNIFRSLPQLGKIKKYITAATYYRLVISDILPKSLHRVLYLDGDIIVRHSLEKLWNENLDNYAMGVVEDLGGECGQDFKRLGYDPKFRYFNAGVLLINLDFWRQNDLRNKFFEFMEKYPERIELHDQDVLNITLYDKVKYLPFSYNFQNGFLRKPKYSTLEQDYLKYEKEILSCIGDPVIVHFTDQKKPWHIEDCNPYGYEFLKYLKQTEWRYIPLRHCYKSKLRHLVGTVLRKMKLLSQDNEELLYYSLEEINKIRI